MDKRKKHKKGQKELNRSAFSLLAKSDDEYIYDISGDYVKSFQKSTHFKFKSF